MILGLVISALLGSYLPNDVYLARDQLVHLLTMSVIVGLAKICYHCAAVRSTISRIVTSLIYPVKYHLILVYHSLSTHPSLRRRGHRYYNRCTRQGARGRGGCSSPRIFKMTTGISRQKKQVIFRQNHLIEKIFGQETSVPPPPPPPRDKTCPVCLWLLLG